MAQYRKFFDESCCEADVECRLAVTKTLNQSSISSVGPNFVILRVTGKLDLRI